MQVEKWAGVVTLYHPDEDVLKNIQSYAEDLDMLLVLDNTEAPNPVWEAIFRDREHVKYIPFHENKGISYALNYALKEAVDYEYLLTMDQDSRFPQCEMKKYKEVISAYEKGHAGEVAMYTVNYAEKETNAAPREIEIGITSGSILPVSITKVLGGFDEALFIDEVDSEYCYRAADQGYKVVEFPEILMHHSIGNRTYHSILGFHFNTFNHSPIRRYYIARNHVYVFRKYPRKRVMYITDLIKFMMKILLVEKRKKEKLRYMAKGIRDGICGRMGKYMG